MSNQRGNAGTVSYPEWMPRGLRHAFKNVEAAGAMCREIPGCESTAEILLSKVVAVLFEMEKPDSNLHRITRLLNDVAVSGARLQQELELSERDGGAA